MDFSLSNDNEYNLGVILQEKIIKNILSEYNFTV